jgi:uncharacterized membrane protein
MSNNPKRTTGIALAIAAAGLFTIAPLMSMAADDDDAKVHCYGANQCKGKNDCKSADNACKGKSSCKGKGFLNMSEEECDKVGGTVKDEG